MAPSTEIHIPASPTGRFANMLFFLVASLARNAGFEGPWKAVITLGRDGDLTPDSPEFSWSRDYPVEFRHADPQVWQECEAEATRRRAPGYIYNATILRQFTQPYEADMVIFMDADTLVTRPLPALMTRIRAAGALAAKPAWQPPPLDLAQLLARAGLVDDGSQRITYSGYGWSFLEPQFGPPYLNAGFMLCPLDVAERLRLALPRDFAFVAERYSGHYIWQAAQCLTVMREAIPCMELDERYNMGIGAPAPSILPGPAGAALDALGEEQARDAHVLHYCTPTPRFVRDRTMADDAALAAFLAAQDLDEGEAMLRDAMAPFAADWHARRKGPQGATG
ncbi:hypothetical protein LCGC14_1790540 [marine sediment metagenome]|uniref:Nucleotide-diphospho-sugar transferase domain-containing protein n=1 Tax=marine sediment metagenome TaxID=412755 RepID=A0A0F9J7K5_9ZZZZ